MPADLVAAVVGWLVQVLGDAGISLVRGPRDARELRKAVAQAIDLVVDRADPGSREALRRGLEQCFSTSPQIRGPVSSASVGEVLRRALAAQVGQLEQWVNNDTGRPFYQEVSVGPRWVTEQLLDAFVTALRQVVAGSGLAELVHGLDTSEIMAGLDALGLQIRGLAVDAPVTPELEGPAAAEVVSADAILRGPVAHLGLAQRLRDADNERDTDPAAAAASYGVIADALVTSPYAPHARLLRERQANALLAADDVVGGVEAELAVMAAALSAGDPWQVLIVAHQLDARQLEMPDHLTRAINCLANLAAYEHYREGSLDAAAEALDATESLDPYRLEAAVLFAEHAIASSRPALVRDRLPVMAAIANAADLDEPGRLAEARIRACIADATGEWGDLSRAARTGYPPRAAALLLARHGRHLAITQEPAAAIDRYYEAIEKACTANAYADASDWLFAIRLIRIRYGIDVVTGDLSDLYRLALTVQTAGNDSVIPAAFSPRERVLSALQDGNFPDALEALHRYRWRSVTIASWADEQEAEGRFGALYMEVGELHQAIEHFVAAGDVDQLTKVAESLPEVTLTLPVSADLADRPSWQRAAHFTIAAAAADLVSDADAVQWIAAALMEITEAAPVPVLTRDPSLDACTAFGHLADAATEDQAGRFLDLAWPWIEREPDQYRHTDEAQAEALTRIARAHPPLRAVTVEQMCQALLVDQRMGGIVLSRGSESLTAEPDIVAVKCGQAAAEGHIRAALALVLAGADTAAVVPLARQYLDSIEQPHIHKPGHHELSGGWQDEAILSITLTPAERARFANAMIAIIDNQEDLDWNKELSLQALATVARYLDDADRDLCLPTALAIARSERGHSADRRLSRAHRLNRIRVNIGADTLRHSGLLAAGALAHTSEQYADVVTLAYELMPQAGPQEANRIARALALLPASQAGLDPVNLAAHSSEWIRALAAVVWCTTGGQPTELGSRLAADPSSQVRRTLASHLPSTSHYDEPRAVLVNDVRRSVRAAIRISA